MNSSFFKLPNYAGLNHVTIKLEGLNIAGSIKFKTAHYLINGLEQLGKLVPGTHRVIESSSGNLGIALSIVCKMKGYPFTCITDPNALPKSIEYMKLYGAEIIHVTQKDSSGGYLGTRINLIKELISADTKLVWTNQYESPFNIQAHYETTAKEIHSEFPDLDFLFVGAGTTGTLGGCAQYFKKYSEKTKIIAVDSIGSVTFGFNPGPRYIPGIGTSQIPPICSTDNVADIVLVDEKDAVACCHRLVKQFGLCLGGSSGSVMHAIQQYASEISADASVVAISPDFGEKYLDSIYNPAWVQKTFRENI